MHILQQADLFANEGVLGINVKCLPRWPLATDNFLIDGLKRVPFETALKQRYMQLNAAKLVWVLVFDIDRPNAVFAAHDAGLPLPNVIIKNPHNGHAHLCYVLAAPVSKGDASKGKPIRLLARIEHALTNALGADLGYSGLIAKTPGHPAWQTFSARYEAYGLDELRDYLPDNLPLPKKIKRAEAVGLGRNVTLFDNLRYWAYRERLKFTNYNKWHRACMEKAETLNVFATPLPHNEVQHTVKSVSKWVWRNFSHTQFSEIQSRRGKLSGIARASKRMDRLAKALELDL